VWRKNDFLDLMYVCSELWRRCQGSMTAKGGYATGQGKAVVKERQIQRETGKMNKVTVF
jgi:hypothetical protein